MPLETSELEIGGSLRSADGLRGKVSIPNSLGATLSLRFPNFKLLFSWAAELFLRRPY